MFFANSAAASPLAAPTVSRFVLALALGALALGCSSQKKTSEPLPSSADDPSYAVEYPNELAQVRGQLEDADASATSTTAELPSREAGIDPENSRLGVDVVKAADESGRSRAFAEKSDESARFHRFLEEEKEPLRQQVAGSVRYAIKDSGAGDKTVDTASNAAASGMQRALDKQLGEHDRSANRAHRLLEEHEADLDKADLEHLQKLADDVARTSHVVHVVLPRAKERIDDLLAEKDSVKKSLEADIEKEKKVSSDEGASKKRKELADKRIGKANEALGALDAEATGLTEYAQNLERRQKDLERQYEDARDQLERALDERAKEFEEAEAAKAKEKSDGEAAKKSES